MEGLVTLRYHVKNGYCGRIIRRRNKNKHALARTLWTREVSTLERASNAIAATSVWRDILSPFCFESNLAPAQLISQSGCAPTSSRTIFCFGWRNAEATFHLYTSTRNLHAPLANVKQLYRVAPPGPHFDLVYFWPVCLSDATIQTIVPILWSTITIYCDDGVRRVSLAHTCSSHESTVSTRSLSYALSIAWSSSLHQALSTTNRSSDWLAPFIHSFVH